MICVFQRRQSTRTSQLLANPTLGPRFGLGVTLVRSAKKAVRPEATSPSTFPLKKSIGSFRVEADSLETKNLLIRIREGSALEANYLLRCLLRRMQFKAVIVVQSSHLFCAALHLAHDG
jgi:hypothetical protein